LRTKVYRMFTLSVRVQASCSRIDVLYKCRFTGMKRSTMQMELLGFATGILGNAAIDRNGSLHIVHDSHNFCYETSEFLIRWKIDTLRHDYQCNFKPEFCTVSGLCKMDLTYKNRPTVAMYSGVNKPTSKFH
jgi:hypothetical protein